MSGSHHEEHHNDEKKPVAFTVPIIFASVTVLVILLFLSLCDPKKHHGKCECKEPCSKECMEACEKGDKHHGHDAKAANAMKCPECKSECTEACMEACEKGDHGKHMSMHKMTCGECKTECSKDCMDACMKGDHSKHMKEAAKMDSIAVKESAPAH